MNLDIPLVTSHNTYPQWHCLEPIVAVVELDPGYRILQAEFSLSWRTLIHIKGMLDAFNAICYHTHEMPEYRQRIRPIVEMVMRDLKTVAQAERMMGRDSLAQQIDLFHEAMLSYAQSGTWPEVTLFVPPAQQPWLFCGPLKSWSTRNDIEQLTLFVMRGEPTMQAAIDGLDRQVAEWRTLVSSVCKLEIETIPHFPRIAATQLLLAGGVSALGHKQFAQFFPEDTRMGQQAGTSFTILFGNVYRERLKRCSLACLQAVSSVDTTEFTLDEIVQAAVTWFRGHDLGHFWDVQLAEARKVTPLSLLEWSTLEETLADALGIIVAAQVIRSPTLVMAFAAEILRYLIRDHWAYPDSAAAMLEMSWLHERACLPWEAGGGSLEEVVQAMRELVPLVRAALIEQDQQAIAQLRAVLHRGRAMAEPLAKHLFSLPSDLEYSFG